MQNNHILDKTVFQTHLRDFPHTAIYETKLNNKDQAETEQKEALLATEEASI